MEEIKKALLPADNLVDSLNQSTKDCVKVLDIDATILTFNPAGFKLMEIDDPQTILGSDWMDFWKGDMSDGAKKAFYKAKNGELGYFEGYCPTQKGTPKWWEVTIIPLKNDRKEVVWILSMSRDVTELHELRQQASELKLMA